MTDKGFQSVGQGFLSGFAEELRKSTFAEEPRKSTQAPQPAPKSKKKKKKKKNKKAQGAIQPAMAPQAEHWYGLAAQSDDNATRAWATDGLRRVEAKRARAAASAPTAGERTSGNPDAGMPNVPPAAVHETPVPTLASPEQVLLDGIAAGQKLGGYSFSYAMGQLNIYVWQSKPSIGGWYQVGSLPIGEWFVILDRRGFPLPVAIQKVREHAFHVRVDPAPLQGLRTLTSTPE
jgi:hypothetical protein